MEIKSTSNTTTYHLRHWDSCPSLCRPCHQRKDSVILCPAVRHWSTCPGHPGPASRGEVGDPRGSRPGASYRGVASYRVAASSCWGGWAGAFCWETGECPSRSQGWRNMDIGHQRTGRIIFNPFRLSYVYIRTKFPNRCDSYTYMDFAIEIWGSGV